ncbi:hydroxyectoine utilization dehydratase EutB [Nitratireductor sp. XY-223]|uniref:hydroxyectoine utilization dehydratase EutB n=1 Tax=Nitratireductor sp. XY-223 TaxID=2561926 RepID=UPI001FEDC051|nr:hydroxyectoine utilization dehydratase EutB [Nitratireductor sp. XY-223]
MSTEPVVGPEEIGSARKTIAATIRLTPVDRSAALEEIAGSPVYLKLEHTQVTGSFKLRGATNAVANLSEGEKARGVVGVSTGNHGRGLAYAARAAGVPCIICMSSLVPQAKIDGIRAQGADVRIIGKSQDEAQEEVNRLVRDEGMVMIPPFDQRDIIAGQGTLGLELLEQVPDAGTILVPVSGGGLISGVAAAIKAQRPGVRIIGVSMERGAAMYACQKAGKPVPVEELPTLADSLGGGIGLDNQLTFAMTRDLVDDLLLVSETEIAAAIRHLYWKERQIVEGSGAVGVAAILAGKVRAAGPVVAILSGGNIDLNQHHRIVSGEDVDVSKEAA